MFLKKCLRKISVLAALVMLMLTVSACGEQPGYGKTFTITLYPEYAPITCENFEKLVKSGFYDGLTFHRLMDDFMAQGGDPKGDGTGGSSEKIKGEFSANGVQNDLKHTRGIVSMARGSYSMDSASSQFFICYVEYPSLDGNYAAFGEVTEGMEVVDSFLQVERIAPANSFDRSPSQPTSPIVIDSMKMIEDDAQGHHRVLVTMRSIPVKK